MLSLSWLSRLLSPRRSQSLRRERAKERRLNLMRLERRRVLNADFTFTPQTLTLNRVDGDLTIREVSSGLTSHIEFDLSGSVWHDDGSTGSFAIDNSTPGHSILSIEKSDFDSLAGGASLSAAASTFDLHFDVQSSSLDLSHMQGALIAAGFGTISQTTSNDYDVKVADVSLSASHIRLSSFHGDDITLNANEIDFTGGDGSFSGMTLSILSATTPAIELGGLNNDGAELNFTDSDIAALDAGFTAIHFSALSFGDSSTVTVDESGADFSAALSPHMLTSDGHPGSLNLEATTVQIHGDLTSNGGVIEIDARDDITVSHAGKVISHGGHVSLDAGEHGTLLVSGEVDVSDSDAGDIGGTVHLLGERVGLFGDARVDASGALGGGAVLIGGDNYGANAAIHNASQVWIGSDVEVHADAIHHGNGGKIVVWSDNATQVYGSLAARGGRESGDGGLIETSSLSQLILSGSGDASATNGRAGTWLLDPYNVAIRHTLSGFGVDDTGQLPNFTPTASGSEVTDTAIENQLNAGTNVVISTANPFGGEAGNVTQAADASIDVVFTDSGNTATFTINAANHIFLDGGITVANGTLDVVLNANAVPDDPDLGNGNVSISASINTNGGTFASSGIDFDNIGGAITATGGVTIEQTGTVILGAIDTGDGFITVMAGGNITDSGAVSVAGSASFTTTQANNDITLDLLQLSGTLALNTIGPNGHATVVNATSIDFASASVAGNLTATALSGDITDSGVVLVGHDAQFTTNQINNGIDLNRLQIAGTLSLNTSGSNGDASVMNVTAIDFSSTNVGGNLTAVATTGNITDSAAVIVGGNASFTASQIDDDIDLNLLQLSGTVSLSTFGSLGNASVVNAAGLEFAATEVGGRLNATAVNGDITGGATLSVGENARFVASNGGISIAAAGSINFGSLTFVSTGDVSIAEDSATVLSGNSAAINLNLTSADAIATDGTAIIAIDDNASFTGTSILLGDQAGDLLNFGTLTFHSAGEVAIDEDSATVLSGTGAASALNLRSNDTIGNDGTANVLVENNAKFSGASITLDDVYQFGSLTFTSSGVVQITEADATVLQGSSTASDLDLRSSDAIANDSSAVVSIDNNASFHGTSITLGQEAGDLLNFGTLTFDSTGEVSIAEDSDIVLSGTGTAESLDLRSTDAITNDGTANVVVESNARFSGTSITLDDVYQFGTLTFNSAGDVDISEADSTELSGDSTALNLILTNGSSIDDGASGTVVVAELTTLVGISGSVILDNGNDFRGLVTVNSGDASTLHDINSVTLTDSNIVGVFTVTASDSIILDGLIMAGSATMTAASESISGIGILTASTVDLISATGIFGATSDDYFSVSATTISAAVTGAFDVKIANENASQTSVTSLTTVGGNLEFSQLGGGAVTFEGPITSGDLTAASPVSGGSITLTSASELTIAAAAQALSSEAGSGGSLSISGATILRAIRVGEGDISINGAGEDLLISADISANASVDLSAIQDVIVTSTITVSGATSDLKVTADSDFDGSGGFWLNEEPLASDAQLLVDQDIAILGSNLVATGVASDAIRIDSEGDALQITGGRDLTLSTTLSVGLSAGDIIIEGRQFAGGSITVSSNDVTFVGADQQAGIDLLFQSAVRLTDDVALAAGGDLSFESTLDDDGSNTTGSALTLIAGGASRFAGAVGAIAGDRLDTLTIEDAESVHFEGTVTIDGDIDVTTTGLTSTAVGTVTFDDAVTTTAGLASGSVEITNFGRLIISPGADLLLAGAFTQNGTESIELGGNITTSNGGVSFDRAILLTESVTIDSSNQSGDLVFSDLIDSEDASGVAEHNSLTLTSGAGLISFNGDIGTGSQGNQTLGDFTIVTAGAVRFGGNDASDPSGSGTTGPMNAIATNGVMDIGVGGNVVAGGIVFTAESGLFVVTTTNDTVRFNGPVTLASDLDINTNATGTGGTVTFTADSPIDSNTGGSFALTIDAGTQQVLFNNDLGQSRALRALTITQADGGVSFGQADTNQGPGSIGPVMTVAIDGPIDIGVDNRVILGGIELNAGSGSLLMTTANDTVRFNGAVTLDSAVELKTNSAGGGGTVTFTSSTTIDSQTGEHNDLTIDAGTQQVLFNNNLGQFNALGKLTVTQADGGVIFGQVDTNQGSGTIGPVELIAADDTIDIGVGENIILGGIVLNAGNGTLHLTTTDDSVRFNGAVTLAAHVDINTNSSANGTSSLASGGTVTFTSSATIDSQVGEHNDLTIDAGTEQVQFSNNLGEAQSLGALTIIQADGGVSFGQPTAFGQGDEDLSPGGAGPVTKIVTDGTIDIGVGSNVVTGGIVLDGGLDSLLIRTTDDTIRFNGPVTLGSDVDIDTNATGQGGTVTFTSATTIDSQPDEHNDLKINVGTAQVLFNNDLGASQSLGALTITQANAGVIFGENDADQGSGMTGPVSVIATDEPIDIGVGDNIVAGGIVLNAGSGTLQIETTDDSIRFNGPVTLSSNVEINTNLDETPLVGGGTVTFTSASPIDSQAGETNDLTIDVGVQQVLFNNDLGASQQLGALTITQADGGVTFGQSDSDDGLGTGPVTTIATDGAIDIGVDFKAIIRAGVVPSTGITFNAGGGTLQITTTDDAVRLNGPVTLQSSVDINTNTAATGIGGTVTFTSDATIDGEFGEFNDLTIDAGTRLVLFNNDLGQTHPIGALTITQSDGGVIFGESDDFEPGGHGTTGPVSTVSTNGAIDIGVGSNVITGGILLNGGDSGLLQITVSDEPVRFNGAVTLATDVDINTNATPDSGGGTMTFTSAATIDSQSGEHNDLTIDAGTQQVLFNNNLGQTDSLGALTVTQADGGVIFGESDTFEPDGPGTTGPVAIISADEAIDIGAVEHIIAGGIVLNAGNVDRTSPTVTLTAPHSTNDTTPSVTVTASDPDLGGTGSGVPDGTVVSLDVDLDNSGDFDGPGERNYASSTLTGGTTTFELSPALTDLKTYQLRARVSDLAGNEATTPALPMIVDTTLAVETPQAPATDLSSVVSRTLQITTTDDTVRFNGPVSLLTNVDINTNPSGAIDGGGTTTFTSASTIDGQSDESNHLTIDVGAQRVLFNNDIGQVNPIGALTITRADAGVVFGESDLDQGPGLTGPVSGIMTNGLIDIGVGVNVIRSDEDNVGIIFNAGVATLILTTTDDTVRINGAVTLASGLDINTNPAGLGATVTFTSSATIDSESGEHNDLTIDVGTFQVLFNNDLGRTDPLGALIITQADGGVTFGESDNLSNNDGTTGLVSVIATDGAIDIGVLGNIINGGILFNGGPNPLLLTTTDDPVRYNGQITLGSDLSIDTNDSGFGGTVTFTSSAIIDSQSNEQNELMIDAGAQQVLFNNNIGETVPLGALTIVQADAGMTFGESVVDLGPGTTGPVSIVTTVRSIDLGQDGNVVFGGIVLNAGIVDERKPTVTLTAPSQTDDITPSVTVTASDPGEGSTGTGIPNGTNVSLDVDLTGDNDFDDAGELNYATSTLTGGTSTFDLPALMDLRTYQLRARVSDPAGNEGMTTPLLSMDVNTGLPSGPTQTSLAIIDATPIVERLVEITSLEDRIRINGPVTSLSDTILRAAEGITLTDFADITTTNHNLEMFGDTNQTFVDDSVTDAIAMGRDTFIDAGSGYIHMNAASILLGHLTTTNAGTTTDPHPAVHITATTGAIRDSNSDIGTDSDFVNITANALPTVGELDVSLTDSETMFVVSNINVGLDTPFTIQVEQEQMLVTAIAGDTLTVTRGANGTSAVMHAGSVATPITVFAVTPGAGVVLEAVTGIGSGDAIETEVDTLQARNMDALDAGGGVRVAAQGNIQIVEVPSGGNLNLINVRNQANAQVDGDELNGVIDVTIIRDPQLGLPGLGAIDGSLTVLDDDLGGFDATGLPYGLLAELKGDPALLVIPGDQMGVQSENTIRLTAFNITINDDILAVTDVDAGTTYETIELHARGDFVLAANRVITTDENFAGKSGVVGSLFQGDPSKAEVGGDVATVTFPTKPRVTDDRIRIVADVDFADHVDAGNVFLGRSSTISTDAGIEQLISRRPAPNESGTAFFDSTSVVTSDLNANGLDSGGSKYLGFLTITIGKPGEKNLILDVDWGDTPRSQDLLDKVPSGLRSGIDDFNTVRASKISDQVADSANVLSDSNINPPTLQGTNYVFDAVVDKHKTRFFIPEGGLTYVIPHEYSSFALNRPNDLHLPGRFAPSDPFQVRFSVSTHPSINIQGRSISEHTIGPADAAPLAVVPASSPIAPLALLSSTDILEDNAVDDHGPSYTTDVIDGTPDFYQDEAIFRLNSGAAEFSIPTSAAVFFIKPDVVIPPPELPKPSIPLPVFVTAPQLTTESLRGATASSSVTTDEFFELHLVNEDGTIVSERLRDGEALLDRDAFEKFVRDRGDGEYEIWFITRENGTGARIERPVVQFRLEGGRLTPPANDSQELSKPFRLVPVPVPAPKPMPAEDAADEMSDDNDSAKANEALPSPGFESSSIAEPQWGPDLLDSTTEIPHESSNNSAFAYASSLVAGALILLGKRGRRSRFMQQGASRFSRSARLIRKRSNLADDV